MITTPGFNVMGMIVMTDITFIILLLLPLLISIECDSADL
jgi:hypothetical protein